MQNILNKLLVVVVDRQRAVSLSSGGSVTQVQLAAESVAIIEDNGHPVELLMNGVAQQRLYSVSAVTPCVRVSLQIDPVTMGERANGNVVIPKMAARLSARTHS
ncbi:hypothetical protein LSAT2_004589, partial [Lamellibrachia satsuma]